jgi:hypothetical protein
MPGPLQKIDDPTTTAYASAIARRPTMGSEIEGGEAWATAIANRASTALTPFGSVKTFHAEVSLIIIRMIPRNPHK